MSRPSTAQSATEPIFVAGSWRESDAVDTFQAHRPQNRDVLPSVFPVSSWKDCDAALTAAVEAYRELQCLSGEDVSRFLNALAVEIERHAEAVVEAAHAETGLPVSPRLRDGELPRTTGQLRQAAEAALSESWRMPTIDAANNIRSCYGPVGPVCVFGPNNFPFAFGSVSGGDFAAAIAAGNPVIGKANSSHPLTTKLLAEAAHEAIRQSGMPQATVQMIYRTMHTDGQRLVSDPRLAATAYTGSRAAGLKLKQAAESAGRLIYLELSSLNPVVVLPGSLDERPEQIADEFAQSCLMGTGQFCTNPGLVVLLEGALTEALIGQVVERFSKAPVGTLLSAGVENSLVAGIQTVVTAGAQLLMGGQSQAGPGYSLSNTLLRTTAQQFLTAPATMQTELFGNASLFVVAGDLQEAIQVIESLEGNLTGSVYSHTQGHDDSAYDQVARPLRTKVGRLLNDKMPTGVAVSPAMNHGGPYPATGHPHFTAVGMPASIARFTTLQCYDNVRPSRLPPCLQE